MSSVLSARLRVLAEDLSHLGGGLEVVLVAVELEAVRVVHRRSRADAQQDLLRLRIVSVHVVQVVRADERHPELLGELEQVTHRAPLDVDAVVGDLGEEVLLAEDVLELGSGLAGLVVLAETESGLHLAADASRGGDDALRVPREHLAVHARLVVVALDRGERRHPEQVVHAGVVLGEQGHVRVGTRTAHVIALLRLGTPAHPGLVAAVRARGDVRLGADDRLDAVVGRRLPEVVRTEHVAVVGHRDGGHALGRGGLDEGFDPRRAIQHRVVGVHVEVDERLG